MQTCLHSIHIKYLCEIAAEIINVWGCKKILPYSFINSNYSKSWLHPCCCFLHKPAAFWRKSNWDFNKEIVSSASIARFSSLSTTSPPVTILTLVRNIWRRTPLLLNRILLMSQNVNLRHHIQYFIRQEIANSPGGWSFSFWFDREILSAVA